MSPADVLTAKEYDGPLPALDDDVDLLAPPAGGIALGGGRSISVRRRPLRR